MRRDGVPGSSAHGRVRTGTASCNLAPKTRQVLEFGLSRPAGSSCTSKRELIPAVNHVDDTGRLQSVEPDVLPRYWRLISEFDKLTGVPILLNTSFNENEPIVMTPAHAIETFQKTRMDMLVLGNHVVRREL